MKNNKNLISLGFVLLIVFALSLLTFLPKPTSAYYFVGWENGEYVGYFKDVSGYSNGNYNNRSNNNSYSNNYTNNNNNFNNNVSNPTPFINSITPNSGTRNTSKTITVLGNGFVLGSVVKLNGADLYTAYIDSGTLRAQITSANISTAGDYLVTVWNPSPDGGISNSAVFTAKNVVASASTTSKSKTVASTSTNNTTSTTSDTSTTTSKNQTKDLAASAIFGSNAFMPSSLLQWIFFFILILLGVILWRRLYAKEEDTHIPLKHA